jgi:hypothetical protein
MQESGENGRYVDHKSYEVPNGRPNNYARELKDGPLGTSRAHNFLPRVDLAPAQAGAFDARNCSRAMP